MNTRPLDRTERRLFGLLAALLVAFSAVLEIPRISATAASDHAAQSEAKVARPPEPAKSPNPTGQPVAMPRIAQALPAMTPPTMAAEKGKQRSGQALRPSNANGPARASTPGAHETSPDNSTDALPDGKRETAAPPVSVDVGPVDDETVVQLGDQFAAADVPWPALVSASFDQGTAERALKTLGGWLVVFDRSDVTNALELAGGFSPFAIIPLSPDVPQRALIIPVLPAPPALQRWISARWHGGPWAVGWLVPSREASRLYGIMALTIRSAHASPQAIRIIVGRWEGAAPHFVPYEIKLRSGEIRPVVFRNGGTDESPHPTS